MDDKVTISVPLPEDALARLRAAAKERGVSTDDILEELIMQELKPRLEIIKSDEKE